MWGDNLRNTHGEVIEEILAACNLCILNNGSSTHLHKQTNTETCLSLAIGSPDIFTELECAPEPNTHGSDHFPCII